MKRTGSEVLALTAALTASSIFRESVCLSKYSCTDIFFFLRFLLLLVSSNLWMRQASLNLKIPFSDFEC